MRVLRGGVKMLAFFVFTIMCVPPQLLVLSWTNDRLKRAIPIFYFKGLCLIFRIKIKTLGTRIIKEDSSILYISNHISYLDIPVLGTAIPSPFIAKDDVSSWPVFGFLAKLHQTVFMSRTRSAAKAEMLHLESQLGAGKSLILFPEGTSTEGLTVRPFKSSLFGIMPSESLEDLYIQPVSLYLSRVDNRPARTLADQDLYAWHINMDTPLPTHLWTFAKSAGANLIIQFHKEINARTYTDRKTLAKACHEVVSNGLTELQKSQQTT